MHLKIANTAIKLFTIITALCLTKCANNKTQKQSSRTTDFGLHVQNAKALVKTGDIIFRRGADAISDMFCRVNNRNTSYSHCGICLIQNDSTLVLHSIGDNSNLNNCIRREPIEQFLVAEDTRGFGVYRHQATELQIQRMMHYAIEQYNNKVVFDMKFDLGTDSAQYCTEYVHKALAFAFGKSVTDSTLIGKQHIITTDDIFLNNNCRLVYQYFRKG